MRHGAAPATHRAWPASPDQDTRMPHPVITALGLDAEASGTYLGHGQWAGTTDAGVIEPVNPSTGEILGRVHASSESDYEAIVAERPGRLRGLALDPGPAPRRGDPPVRRRAAREQGCAWARWSRWRWARSSPRATAKCRR
jgi:hypothetical protein